MNQNMMQFHYTSVMIMGIVMATLCVTTLFLKSDAFENNDSLRRSRTNLSLGFFSIALNCILHGIYQFRFNDPSVGVALDISCYYSLIIFFGFTYIPLLDPAFDSRKRKLSFGIIWALCSTFVWLAALVLDGTLSVILQIAGGILFFFSVARISFAFSRRYHNVSNMLTELSVDNVENFSRFLYSSLVVIIVTGIFAALVSILGNIEIQCYFNLVSTLLFWRLFMSFANYLASLR